MSGDLPDWTSQHASGAVLLGTLSLVPGGSKSASLLLDPVPAGVTGLSVIIVGTMALGAVVTSVTAIGQVTGQNYIIGAGIEALTLQTSAEYGGSIPAEAESINVAVDTQNGAATAGVLALVVGWLGNTLVHPQNDPNQPLYIAGPHTPGGGTVPDIMAQGPQAAAWDAGVGGFPPASIDQVVGGLVALMQNPAAGPSFDLVVGGNQGAGGKSVQTAREAPQKIYSLGQSVTANTVVQAINGVAGQSIRLRRLSLAASINGSEVDLQTSPTLGSAVFAKFEPTNGPLVFDFEGYVMPAGDNLYLALYWPASTVIVLATLTYDQF